MKAENRKFISNILGYLKYNTINNMNETALPWAELQVDPIRNALGAELIHLLDEVKYVEVDFVAVRYKPPRARNSILQVIPRPIIKTIAPPQLRSGRYRSGYSKLKGKPTDDTILEGYWCPYNNRPVNGIDDIDFVDIPKRNPRWKFVFTGAMHGCHLVVSASPKGTGYYRVYHYQSPEGNSYFYPPRRGRRWPYPVYCWLKYEDYAVTDETYRRLRNEQNIAYTFNGFNFMHYDMTSNCWSMYSHPVTVDMIRDDRSRTMVHVTKLRTDKAAFQMQVSTMPINPFA